MAASFGTVVLIAQLLLACWQIARLTPLALLLKAVCVRLQTECAAIVGIKLKSGYCIPRFSYAGPFLKTTLRAEMYNQEPTLAVLRADGLEDLPVREAFEGDEYAFEWHNYKCNFRLEKQNIEGDCGMFLHARIDKKAIKYYITGRKYWQKVLHIFSNPMLVVVRNKKEFLGTTLTGEIMSPEAILDDVLLRMHFWLLSDRGWLLPLVSPAEETKLLASLNLVGVYGQVRKWSNLLITVWTMVVTLLQFSNWLRQTIYRYLNGGLVWLLQSLIDMLPDVRRRRFLYSLGTFWEGLAPCNTCEARVVRGKKVELYSVSNVKCNDLAFIEQLPPNPSHDDDDVFFQNELISGRTIDKGCTCYIEWGSRSNRTGFRDESPSRAMIKAMVEHRSGAVYSKQGRRVKVWDLLETFNRVNMDGTAKVVLWEGSNVVVK